MRILYLSLERHLELEDSHVIKYLDYNELYQRGLSAILDEIAAFKPDILIEREFNDGLSLYTDLVAWVKANLPHCVRAVWLIDTHVAYLRHRDYAPLFDFCFLAISEFVDEFRGYTKAFWLPLCYPQRSDRIKRNKGRVKHDIVFVGRWGGFFKERTRYVEFLQKTYGKQFYAVTDYDNMEDIIRNSVISFNCSLGDDLNFRVWETLANGVELLTNPVPDLYKIEGLIPRIHVYHNEAELTKAIDSILEGVLEKETIKNQLWTQRFHSLIHRHRSLLRMIETGAQEEF
jgi:hypothetical protein